MTYMARRRWCQQACRLNGSTESGERTEAETSKSKIQREALANFSPCVASPLSAICRRPPDALWCLMSANVTRQFLKSTARRLFAERGFDGVTVRDIMEAAGQRNGASLYYYFGTKEALALELVADGAKLIDERRNALLDAAEQGGGPSSLRGVVKMLVDSSTALDGNVEEDSYIRFITMLQMTHRDLFMQALAGRWNSGYTRCLAHIRSFLPELDTDILNQRLVFMSLYLTAVMSQREAALHGGQHRFWSAPNILENYIDTIVGLLTEPSHPTARSNGLSKREPSRAALLEAGTRF